MVEINAELIISCDSYECKLGGVVIACIEISEKKCSLCGNACTYTQRETDTHPHSWLATGNYNGSGLPIIAFSSVLTWL